jgi:hypothetical protein
MTSPAPLTIRVLSRSATTRNASSFRRKRSVRQSLASSTQARGRLLRWALSFSSKRSKSVKASAVEPANPASTWSSASLRTLRAVLLSTVLFSKVTWPSPAMQTLPSRRTHRMVVPWNKGSLLDAGREGPRRQKESGR